MKLVVVGGTGLVATELIRQSLKAPEINSLVALARRPVQLDADASNASKFQSVVVRGYVHYEDSVKGVLAGADACIWYVISTANFDLLRDTGHAADASDYTGLWESRQAEPRPTTFPRSSTCVRIVLWQDLRH